MKNILEKSALKVVVVGDSASGKDALLQSLSPTSYALGTTSVGDFSLSTASGGKIQVFDTPSEERFQSLLDAYLNGADVVVLVFDVQSPRSFEKMRTYFKRYSTVQSQASFILVGYQNNPERNYRAFTTSELQAYAANEKMTYIEIWSGIYAQLQSLKDKLDLLFLEKNSGEILVQSLIKAYPNHHVVCSIAEILKEVIKNKTVSEEQRKQLNIHLRTLRWTCYSMLNTVINVICAVFAQIGLCSKEVLEKNRTDRGNKYMFYAFGEKQCAEQTLANISEQAETLGLASAGNSFF